MPKGNTEHRRESLLNLRECAESIGISANAFRNWRVPHTKVGKENLYALEDVLKVYRERVIREVTPEIEKRVLAEQTDAGAEGLNPATVKLELENERRRLTRAQAEAQEEKNKMVRHETAPFDFVSFSLASLANAIAAHIDSIPTVLIRQSGISPAQADKVRGAAASVGNQIAEIADEDWVRRTYDDYLRQMG